MSNPILYAQAAGAAWKNRKTIVKTALIAIGIGAMVLCLPVACVLFLAQPAQLGSMLSACQSSLGGSPPSSAPWQEGGNPNAESVVKQGRERSRTAKAVIAALAGALAESELSSDANPSVPESAKSKHDGVTHDHQGLGLYHLSVEQTGLGTSELLDPEKSADWFYQTLAEVPGWKSMSLAEACQAVLRSPFPRQCAAAAPRAAYYYDLYTPDDNGPEKKQAVEDALSVCEGTDASAEPSPGLDAASGLGAARAAAEAFARAFADPDAWPDRVGEQATSKLRTELATASRERVYRSEAVSIDDPELSGDEALYTVSYRDGLTVRVHVQLGGRPLVAGVDRLAPPERADGQQSGRTDDEDRPTAGAAHERP